MLKSAHCHSLIIRLIHFITTLLIVVSSYIMRGYCLSFTSNQVITLSVTEHIFDIFQ